MSGVPESPVDLAVAAIVSGRDPDWPLLRARVASAEERQLLEALAVIRMAATEVVPLARAENDTIGIASPAPHVGERWGALEIIETIGHGSHGTVFKAWDTRLARMVALKLVRVETDRADDALREARLLGRLSHPNVVTVHGADRQGDTVGWWMHLIVGRTLEDTLTQDGPRSVEETIIIGLAVGRALAAVHREGLVHNDIKPNNIMRETGGRIVLMDFSTGRVMQEPAGTSTGGTPLYMAPELFRGATPSPQSDIYSLGVVLFRLATGDYPVHGATFADVQRAHDGRGGERLAASRPELPATFARTVDRALAPAPADRFPSVDEFVRSLSAAITTRPEPRRWRWGVAALLVAVMAAFAILYRPASPSLPARANAEVVRQTLAVWHGYENLALEHAARREYDAAARAFADAERVVQPILPDASPVSGWNEARLGWIKALAGRDDEALMQLQAALHKLQQRAGIDHPYRATTFMSYAATLQRVGRYEDALLAVREALAIRQHFLGLSRTPAATVLAATGLTSEGLLAGMRRASVAQDSDGDRLPDVVEIALHLDPARATTRAPLLDGEGDADGDGWSDQLELGWDWDPTRIVAHYGPADPDLLGFERVRDFAGSPVLSTDAEGPGWRIVAESLGHYTMPIPPSLRRDATEAFVMTARSLTERGLAYVGLDLVPEGARFDMDSYLKPDGRRLVKTNTSVIPAGGPEYPFATRRPLLQMVYTRPGGARLAIDGVQQDGRYDGHRSYQEGSGLFFGAFDLFGQVPTGSAVFELVHLVIPVPNAPSPAR